jgi:hypothetical protein
MIHRHTMGLRRTLVVEAMILSTIKGFKLYIFVVVQELVRRDFGGGKHSWGGEIDIYLDTTYHLFNIPKDLRTQNTNVSI